MRAAHVLQGLTELDPETTVTSIDGIGAYDTISRVEGPATGGRHRVSCMFYGSPSEHLWED